MGSPSNDLDTAGLTAGRLRKRLAISDCYCSAPCHRLHTVSRRRSISVTIRGTEHEAAALPLCHSPASFSPSQHWHKPCPRFPPMLLPHLPTFNRSSMPPWTHMRRRQKTSFSPLPSPPSYSPATHPPPFYLFCKASSSNLITAAGAMRG